MLDFFTSIWQWLLSFPDKVSAAFDYLIIELQIVYYDLMASMVESTVSFIEAFTNSTTYLSTFENSYGLLSLDTRYALDVLNIPEAVILIISAMSLRFAIKLIPGI